MDMSNFKVKDYWQHRAKPATQPNDQYDTMTVCAVCGQDIYVRDARAVSAWTWTCADCEDESCLTNT